MRGNRHYSARAVGYKHIIGNENRHFLAVYGVYCGNARNFNAGFILCKLGALKVGLFGGLLLICRNLVHIGYFIRPFIYKRVLGRHYHIGNAEKRIGAGGEHLERIAYIGGKFNLSAVGAANPVALLRFYAVYKVNLVKPFKQLFGIIGNFKHPLAFFLVNNLAAAALAVAVYNLFICKHTLAGGAPVDRHFLFIGKPFFIKL